MTGAATEPAVVVPLPGRSRPQPPANRRDLLGPLLALVFGLSGLLSGFYGQKTHLLVALALLGVLVATVVATGLPESGPARLAAAAMTGLVAWTALSMTWAESVERAWAETDRYVLYGALLVTALAALRTVGSAARALTALTLATGLLIAITVVRLLGGATGMFFDHRLEAPVEYVNGTAGLLLMGLWPALALAAHHRAQPLRSAGLVALASAAGSLLVLTQSRAILPALLVSAVVVLALIPGRLPRLYALLTAFAGVVIALPFTLDVYEQKQTAAQAPPTEAVIQQAGLAILAGAVLAGALWAALVRLRHSGAAPRVARAGAALFVAVVLVGPLAAAGGNPTDELEARWDAFRTLQADEGASARFTDAGGFRYDLWRIAWDDFEDAPLQGLGAGNYGLTYFAQRGTTEPVRQPHSLPLQLLAETGLPGLLLLAGVLGGAGWGLARLARSARPEAWLVAAAGGGAATVWLVHTSVDWLHVIPGLTGIALIGLAAVCARDETAPPAPPGRPGTLALVVTLVAVAVAAAGVGRHYAAVVKRAQAQDQLGADPAAALESSAAALRIDSEDVDTYVTRAAAFARLGDAESADATLALGIAREPSNYVTYALRGDLAARRGDLDRARGFYEQALARNPRDAALEFLVENPASAVTG